MEANGAAASVFSLSDSGTLSGSDFTPQRSDEVAPAAGGGSGAGVDAGAGAVVGVGIGASGDEQTSDSSLVVLRRPAGLYASLDARGHSRRQKKLKADRRRSVQVSASGSYLVSSRRRRATSKLSNSGEIKARATPTKPLTLMVSAEDEQEDVQLGRIMTMTAGCDPFAEPEAKPETRARSNSAPLVCSWEMAVQFDEDDEDGDADREDSALRVPLIYDGDVDENFDSEGVSSLNESAEADVREEVPEDDVPEGTGSLLLPKKKNLRASYTRHSYRAPDSSPRGTAPCPPSHAFPPSHSFAVPCS
jgi:hypothetical protein